MPEARGVWRFDEWLDEVADGVGVPSRRRGRFLAELREHLTDSADRLAESGMERDEADRRAVENMGSAEEVAGAFLAEANAPTVFTRLAGLALIVAAVLAVVYLMQPEPRVEDLGQLFQFAGMVGLYFRQRYGLSGRGRRAVRRVVVLMTGFAVVGLVLASASLLPGDWIWVGLLRVPIGLAALVGIVVSLWCYLVYFVETVRARVLPFPQFLAAHVLPATWTDNPVVAFFVLLLAAATTWLGLWLCCESAAVSPLPESPGRSGTRAARAPRDLVTRRRQRRRLTLVGTVATLVAPMLFLQTGWESSEPHGPAYPAWPVRGDLAGDTRYVDAAREAWNRAPEGTFEQVRALFVGRTPIGAVVVLTGLDDGGTRRVAAFRPPAYSRSPGTRMVLAGDLGTPDPRRTRVLAVQLEKDSLGYAVVVAVAEPGTTAVRLYHHTGAPKAARTPAPGGVAVLETNGELEPRLVGYRGWRQVFRQEVTTFSILYGQRRLCPSPCTSGRSVRQVEVEGWPVGLGFGYEVPREVKAAWMHRRTVREDSIVTVSHASQVGLPGGRLAVLAVLSDGHGDPHFVLAVRDGDVVDFYRDERLGGRSPYGIGAAVDDHLVVFARPGLRADAWVDGRRLVADSAAPVVSALPGGARRIEVTVVDAAGHRHRVPTVRAPI